MRFVLHVAAAALVVAIGMGDLTSATAADRSIQAQIRGRQKIRAELAAALEKGYLTRMDQYHILLDAKEVLNRDDLRGLEQTLSRIGAQQAAARRPATTNATTVKTEASPGYRQRHTDHNTVKLRGRRVADDRRPGDLRTPRP